MIALVQSNEVEDLKAQIAAMQAELDRLKAIASIPSRPADLVARSGGEEFAVLLPDTSRKGAEAIAALILDAVQTVGASVSVGVATLSALPFVEAETLVESADQALYVAKRQGRNRFIVAEV